jgi:hypothetical protein
VMRAASGGITGPGDENAGGGGEVCPYKGYVLDKYVVGTRSRGDIIQPEKGHWS